MKILITTDLFLPSVNGVVTSVLSLVHGLESRGHEVKILTLSGTIHTHRKGNVIYLGSLGAGRIYPGVRIRGFCPGNIFRELTEWHPDVVHSQCEFNTFSIARAVARKCGAPLIHTYHTVYEDYTHYFCSDKRVGRALVMYFTRYIANRVDAIIAPTEKVRRMLNSYGISSPVCVIPTGLELHNPDPDPDFRRALRQKLGIAEDATVLLFVGRLAKEKNIPQLFRLLSKPNLKQTILLVVGDGPFRGELEQQAAEMGIADRVCFAGMIPHQQITAYYRVGDVFVNASSSETQGLTYLEAMAAGLPVVCFADPCVEGLIVSGKTGFACGSEVEMANAVATLLQNPSLRRKIVQSAAALVCSSYTSAAFSAAAEALYRNTTPRKRFWSGHCRQSLLR